MTPCAARFTAARAAGRRSAATSLSLASLVCLLALAGCAEDGPTEIEVAPGQLVTVSEAPQPGNGIVSGIVGDDALYPLEGVDVYIVGLDRLAKTDSGGRFALVDVPPGIYLLEGSKKDHATTQTTVDVRSDEIAKAVLLLARLPPTDPFHTTVKGEGRVGMLPGENITITIGGASVHMDFEVGDSRALTLVLESIWEGVLLDSGNQPPLRFEVTRLGMSDPVLAQEAPNPFAVHVDARILPPGDSLFRFDVAAGFPDPVVLDASVQSFVTVFYNEPAPPGWSILAGSS